LHWILPCDPVDFSKKNSPMWQQLFLFVRTYITRKQSFLSEGLEIPCMDSYWDQVASEPSEKPCMINYGHILLMEIRHDRIGGFPRKMTQGIRNMVREFTCGQYIRQLRITEYGSCCTKTSGRCHTIRQIRRQWHWTRN
jgi:hypothetical protein